MRLAAYALIISLSFLFYQPPSVYGASLSVSFSVGLISFQMEGYTIPQSLVTLKENASTLSTTLSNLDGSFSISTLSTPGHHDFSLYATDPLSNPTASLSHTVILTPGTTTLGNLVLPPTLSSSHSNASIGTSITLTGYGSPQSSILVFLDDTLTQTLTTKVDGSYNTTLPTSDLSVGSHTLHTLNSLSSGYSSLSSTPIHLTLSRSTQQSSSTYANTSHSNTDSSALSPIYSPSSPTTSPLRHLPLFLSRFDPNGDSIISLNEIYPIVSNWLSSWLSFLTTPENTTCDLNHDANCNLTDFSILLYYFNR